MLSNCPKPSRAKYSHWTGIKTECEAARALSVNNPSEGGESIII